MSTAHVVTFHKCGSRWFRRLFRKAAELNGVNVHVAQPNKSKINVSVDRGDAHTLALYRNTRAPRVLSKVQPGDPLTLCVRDPRDVLVSQYWSWKSIHRNNTDAILATREQLNAMPVSEGLRLLVENRLLAYCDAAETWLDPIAAGTATVLKYEDVLGDFHAAMGPALERSGIPLDADGLTALQKRYDFKAMTKRTPGTEDRSTPLRKGVAGDWQNYFDDELAAMFNDTYGTLSEQLGYGRAFAAAGATEEA